MPDLASARKIMDDLLLARIEERHIHCLGREGTSMAGLHESLLVARHPEALQHAQEPHIPAFP
jgi:hypothetical protein